MQLLRASLLPSLLYGWSALAAAESTSTVVVSGITSLICSGTTSIIPASTSSTPLSTSRSTLSITTSTTMTSTTPSGTKTSKSATPPSSSSRPPSTSASTSTSTAKSWKDLDCSLPAATDGSMPVTDRWEQVGAELAYVDADTYYHRNRSDGTSQFSQVLGEYFGYTETLMCQDLADNNGCSSLQVKCEDFDNPAGYMIVLSMIWLERTYISMNSAITAAAGQVSRQISELLDVFAPLNKKGTQVPKVTLDVISLMYSLAVSPMWNKWLREAKIFKDKGNEIGTAKDWANPGVTQAIVIVKDSKSDPTAQELAHQNALDVAVADLTEVWQKGLNATVNNLFNGSRVSTAQLFNIIDGGKFFAFDRVPSDYDLQMDVQKALYSYLIPNAWYVNGNVPVIITTGSSCEDGEPPELEDKYRYTFPSTKEGGGATGYGWCLENKAYYLVGADKKKGWDCNSGGSCFEPGFYDPDGISEMDGSKWGGITWQNIINGSLNTWADNNYQNGGQLVENPSDASVLARIVDDGVSTPGVFRIPVCGADEARKRWVKYSDGRKGEGPGTTANWPCDD